MLRLQIDENHIERNTEKNHATGDKRVHRVVQERYHHQKQRHQRHQNRSNDPHFVWSVEIRLPVPQHHHRKQRQSIDKPTGEIEEADQRL